MRLIFMMLLAAILPEYASPAGANSRPPDDDVLVIGSLHSLHGREPAFDFAALERSIEKFDPDVLVLEVRPDELHERADTPGRPEYPAIVWPLLERTDVEAVAMEPGGETFETLTHAARAAFDALKMRAPSAALSLSEFDSATEALLLAYWEDCAQTQDQTSAALADGLQAAQFALAGAGLRSAQAEWDRYMSDRVRDTVLAYSGKRVTIIASYRNRRLLERLVRGFAPDRSLIASEWLRRTGDVCGSPANNP